MIGWVLDLHALPSRKLIFTCSKFRYTLQKVKSKGADKSVLMGRLFCAFVVLQPLKTGFFSVDQGHMETMPSIG